MENLNHSLSKIRIIYVITTIFLLGLSLFTYQHINESNDSSDLLNNTLRVSLELEKFESSFKDAEIAYRGYLLSHDTVFLQIFYRSLKEYPKYEENINSLNFDDPTLQKHLFQLKLLVKNRAQYMINMLSIDQKRKPTTLEYLIGKSVMDSLHSKINLIRNIETNIIETRNQKFINISILTPLFIVVLFVGALLILFVSYYRLNRSTIESNQLHKLIKEIVLEARAGVCLLRGPNHYVELANKNYLILCNNKDIRYKYFKEILPEYEADGVFEILDTVYKTGKTIEKKEEIVNIVNEDGSIDERILNFTYKPTHDENKKIDGVIINVIDITEQVNSRKEIELKEEQLRIAIEAGDLGTFDSFIQLDKHIWSDRCKELFGLPPETILTRSVYADSIHPEDIDRLRPIGEALHKSGTNGMYEAEFRAVGIKDKKLRWLQLMGKARFDENGVVVRTTGIIQDITKSKEAEQLLKESETRFRTLADSAPVLIWMAETDKLCSFFNNTWLTFTGRTLEQEKGNGWIESVYPEDLEKCINTYTTSFDKRESFYMEYRLKRYDGEYRWVSDKGIPRYTPEGIFEGYVGACMDIHDEKRQSEILKENEERLSIIIEAGELGTWELDLKTNEIKYSAKYLEILGYKNRTELTHEEIIKHLHPDDIEIREKAFKIALETGFLHYQSRVIWNDNSVHWIEGQGKIIYDKEKKHAKMIGTLRDISEEKNYYLSLAQREEKFRLLANSMPQHIWTGDAQGNLNYFNKSVYDYSGLTPKQINKDGWIQIVHPDDREANMKAWIDSVTSGKDFLFEHRFRKYTGEYRWQLSRAIPQRDAEGNIQMWVGTSTDIQDQKDFANKLEKEVLNRTNELVEKNIELEKANNELELFAHISSHDLQEPLRKVQMSISRIAEKDFEILSDKGKEHFKRVQDATVTMQTLIEDLQTYSRTNNKENTFEITNIKDIIEEAIEELKERIDEKQAIIEIDSDCETNIVPFQFKQIFHNLIGNALKFSKPDIIPHIAIKSKLAKGSALNDKNLKPDIEYCNITISDNGIGFETEYNEKIFEVFQRLHGRDKYKGTGIGLAIVKKIVENHYGIITAKGELNVGATFDIYIPNTRKKI